ncbi:putative F-box protein At3g58960 [Eutrema salsugineum]|uniref:putative F-box protein At3g58960 n=1 Tax=Eutrema salsugineum TaxID=72664 RepID=UPI000CED6F25|nr:putative F-box protein At3g58960 [Eutrema salsugineum]
MDRISSLPNEIICHIVSFLSAKEAAFASVLSKRWQNLYTIIPKLDFDDTGSLKNNLDRLLALPASSRIRNFSLKCRRRKGPNHHAHVNGLLCNVLKRGVMELKLDIWVSEVEGYSLPFEVFTSKTLVELKLGSILTIDRLPENALLPALKTLTIESVRFSDLCGCCAFQKLLSACPVLVELVMRNVEWDFWKWSRKVSSQSLERLTINHRYCFGIVEYDLESITFDTPSLTYFKYFDFSPKSYSTVNLGSLVEATVGLTLPQNQGWIGQYRKSIPTSDVTNLIKGLSNVEILDLYDTMTMEAFYYFREAIPVFKNLHHLSVTTGKKICWRTLSYLLNKSPNLKTLVIVGTLQSNCHSFLLPCPVKILEITEYLGSKGDLEEMKQILEKMSCLELVKVCSDERNDKKQLRLRTNLLNLPRSSKCKIQFEFTLPGSR